MRKPRLTISALGLIVMILAIGLAIVRDFTPLLASVAFSITVLLLLSASLYIWLRPNAALQGFALFGWTSLLISFGPLANGIPAPESLGTVALQMIHAALNYPPPPTGNVASQVVATRMMVQTPDGVFLATLAYVQVGHSLMSLGAGLFGGVLGKVYASRFRAHDVEIE